MGRGEGMRKAWPFLIGAAMVAAGCGFVAAQDARDGHSPAITGSLPSAAQPAPSWSGESGSSGHPLITAHATRAAAAKFQCVIGQHWATTTRGRGARNACQAG